MGIELGIQAFASIWQDTTVFGISWIIAAVVTFLAMLFISKDPNDWKELALPVTVLIYIMGITPSFLQFIAAAIMFSIEVFSIQRIGRVIETVGSAFKRQPTDMSRLRGRTALSELRSRMKKDFKQKAQDTGEHIISYDKLVEAIKKGKAK